MATSIRPRRRAPPRPINASSISLVTSYPSTTPFSTALSYRDPRSNGVHEAPIDCLIDILSKVPFISRPPQDAKLPSGWTFHLQSPLSPLHKARQPEKNSLKERGYFHHAASRITTNIDITREEAPLRETNNGDGFAEIAVVLLSTNAGNESLNLPMRFYLDHFNRTFSTDASCLRHPAWHENHMYPTNGIDHEAAYMKWIELIGRHSDSHLYMPSARPKAYSCLGRTIAQQVVWHYQNGHILNIDIENAFSPLECTSLLSALQKKKVTDKQCQKIIRTVIDRFLTAKQFKQPLIEPSLKASDEEGESGRVVVLVTLVTFIIWIGPMLSVPAAYFRRLRTLAARADAGAYLPHLWRTFIKVLLQEWTDLSIVLGLVLAANVALLALPGTLERPESESAGMHSATLADLSRGAGIVSMFVTLGGLLTTLCLIWLHQSMLGTGSSDACKYLLGSAFVQTDQGSRALRKSGKRFTFFRLILIATYLGMPLVLLLWSVIAFVISAVTWTFLFSTRATQVTVVTMCGVVLITPLVTILVFWGPIISKDSLLSEATRGGFGSPW